ncbi:proteinase-activated receptor 1-like [Betta splendens]|uniref:Proteinase-activated receptor 1-like n=1 Tax=Betta splendens TaxID=158456 RepID=A0A6P7P623_BETSP|nr:proteinase-activated receptor 1-like [Betta splendens]
MLSKTLLLLLVCACSSTCAKKNGTLEPRTFVLWDNSVTNEPIDYQDPSHDPDASNPVASPTRNASGTGGAYISPEAVLFLSGPVSTVLIPSFYLLVCAVSVPINACAIVAFALRICPKKPAAIFMLNLACADLLFALLLPFKIAYHLLGNDWRFGPAMCRVVTAAFYCNMYCSVLLVACISVDRLLAVVYPIMSLTWRTRRNSVAACAAAWTLSLAGSAPLVVSEQTVYVEQMDVTTCHDVQPERVMWQHKVYFIALCCLLFLLPLLVTLASYARVIWALTNVPFKSPRSSRSRARALVMTLTVLVMFVLCFAPTNGLLLAHYLQLDERSRETPDGSYAAYLVFVCLGSLNCVLDPLVYYFGSTQCQKQMSRALACRKTKAGGGISQTSSDSCRSSTRKMLKSSRTETSRISDSLAKPDTFQENLSSQYKKLLVR